MQVTETTYDGGGSPAMQQDLSKWQDSSNSAASSSLGLQPPLLSSSSHTLEQKKNRNSQRGSVPAHKAQKTGRKASSPSRTLQNNRRRGQEPQTSGLSKTAAERSTLDRAHLVLSGQPTGWAAMARSVRDFDEEKVRDCKEDIDTLLVFAGLFSAVLTAFLIESYKNLVEDPSTQTLLAIRQLVAQTSSYRVEGGMLNTTVLPYSPEPFQVSRADIRVNVLWFASLLFSLITASFGILVKQWLREFLAVENPSPRARLRVRHVRYPQLVQWRVFQIAAVLPLLLQLSLALFFVGLCYFTASVHSSVEYTALPLVLGWTVCFCTVMVLPVFLPWCPYRTALLRNLLQRLHRVARRVADRVANTCLAVLARPTPLSQWLKVCLSQVARTCTQASATLAEQDEAHIIRHADNDMAILESVDSIQSDDDLLGTAIAEVVDHVLCSPSQFESFLQRIFENRGYSSCHAVISDEMDDPPFPLPVLDLRYISKQTRDAVCAIVSHYATNTRLSAAPVITGDWIVDREAYRMILVCMIMLSLADCPLPEDGLLILRGHRFRPRGFFVTGYLLSSALLSDANPGNQGPDAVHENRASLMLYGLGKLWQHLDLGTDSLLKTAFYAITEYGELDSAALRVDPIRVDDWYLEHLSAGQKSDIMGLLVSGTAGILRKERGTYTGMDFDLVLTLRAILRLSYSTGKYPPADENAFDSVLAALLSETDLAVTLVDALLQAPLSWVYIFSVRFLSRFDTRVNKTYGIDIHAYDWCARLDNYIEVVSTKLANAEHPISSIDALKLCYFATALARFLIPVQPPQEQWEALFSILLDRIEEPCDDQAHLSKAKAAIADHMLNMIYLVEDAENERAWTWPTDGDEELYAAWADSWQDGDGLFPDALLESIAPYAPKTRVSRSWRSRRAIEVARVKQSIMQPQPSSILDGPDDWRDVPRMHQALFVEDSRQWSLL